MRLSDVKGERTLDVIADIIDPVANIAESDAAKALFKKEKLPEGENKRSFAIRRIRKTIPPLLKTNKRDLLTILAVIDGRPYEEFVKKMDLASLTRDLIELFTDSTFVELFMQAQTGEPSGSAQENTGAR